MILKVFLDDSNNSFDSEFDVLNMMKDVQGFPKVVSSKQINGRKEILMKHLGTDLSEVKLPPREDNMAYERLIYGYFVQLVSAYYNNQYIIFM